MTSNADRQRAYRRRKGATSTVGRPIVAECGSVSAYKRHRRKGEAVDDACRQAWNAWQREYQRNRKGTK